MAKFGTKEALFGHFEARILKKYIWNQHPQICQFAKFHDKTVMSRFGTKNALFGYFWATIFKKLLTYLKSAPSNLSYCKIPHKKKKKMPKFGIKNASFG